MNFYIQLVPFLEFINKTILITAGGRQIKIALESAFPGYLKNSTKMPFRTNFNIVLYDKETIWGGRLKDGTYHISLEPEMSIVTICYADMLIFAIAKLWLPLKHETDAQTMIHE